MSLNLYTLADARAALKQYVDNGSCDETRIDARLDEAMRRLFNKKDVPHALHRLRIKLQNCCFPLPYFADTIVGFTVDGTPARVFGQAYEFLSSGPGDTLYPASYGVMNNLIDLGEFPTQFDIPVDDDETTERVENKYKLIAFSTANEDHGKSITVRGYDKLLGEVEWRSSAGGSGDEIAINFWSGGTEGLVSGSLTDHTHSKNYFRQIRQVYKPETKGYVSLYAFDPATGYMYFLAKMHPKETVPHYRRYRVTNCDSCAHCILALVRLRYIRPTAGEDILPIQNLDAIKFMLMALKEEDARSVAAADLLETKATTLLKEQQDHHHVSAGGPVMIDVERRLSMSRMNRFQ